MQGRGAWEIVDIVTKSTVLGGPLKPVEAKVRKRSFDADVTFRIPVHHKITTWFRPNRNKNEE